MRSTETQLLYLLALRSSSEVAGQLCLSSGVSPRAKTR